MKLSEIVQVLEAFAPLSLQETYDNAGLCCGDLVTEISKILVSLDITEEVVNEAIKTDCQLIIAHHPVIFKPLKKLTGSNYVEKTLLKAIKNKIALYTSHTNLDNIMGGVNFKIAEKLGLKNILILQPLNNNLKNLTFFVPVENTEDVIKALGEAGAGQIGNYKNCSFQVTGKGSFTPNEFANPFLGQAFKKEVVEENRVEMIFPSYLESQIMNALINSHPYEEIAHYITNLTNVNLETGSGAIGDLDKELTSDEFLLHLKSSLNLDTIRHTIFKGKINKVAVCGGSGSFLLKKALSSKADAFVSADFKYHEFFDAENKIMIADIGHYESEFYTKDVFFELLTKKFPNIAILFSTVNTNPVKYYC